MSHGLITARAAECGSEIQINILVHIINAPPTSSPRPVRLLGIIRYMFSKVPSCAFSGFWTLTLKLT